LQNNHAQRLSLPKEHILHERIYIKF
jgi:hypothetical protein